MTKLAAITIATLIGVTTPLMAMSTLECRGELMRWRQIKGHKAFVVGRRSDIEYCGWSWKAASKEAATAAATSACKKAGAWDCTVHAAE